jgi:hypothetical protein
MSASIQNKTASMSKRAYRDIEAASSFHLNLLPAGGACFSLRYLIIPYFHAE